MRGFNFRAAEAIRRFGVAAGLVVLTNQAWAYLDPGTGSYFLQLLIGGLLGGLFAVGLFWKRVRAFVRGLFRSKPPDGGKPDDRDGLGESPDAGSGAGKHD